MHRDTKQRSTAWAAGDSTAFGDLHSPTATYGSLMTGPKEIADGHDPLIRGIMRGSRLVSLHRETRLVSPGVAVATLKGGTIMRWQGKRTAPSPKRVSANTTVLVLDGDRWLIEAFQNTRHKAWATTMMGRLMTRSAK